MIDYHVHTNYSFDSEYSMAEMVKQAVELGVEELAFTDHADFRYVNGRATNRFLLDIDFDKYLRELNLLRKRYAGKIRLTFGVEVGVGSLAKKEVEGFLVSQPFEFVIGSLHDYAGVDFYYPDFYEGKTKKQAYEEYFIEMKKIAETVNGFHVFGHLDYIERYGRYEDKRLDYDDFREVIDDTLKAIIYSGRGIEVNTSRMRYKLGGGLDVAHPRFKILKRYRELGGQIITLGSDAHSPEYICSCFKEAKECLRVAGFNAITIYRDGKPVFVDI